MFGRNLWWQMSSSLSPGCALDNRHTPLSPLMPIKRSTHATCLGTRAPSPPADLGPLVRAWVASHI